MQGLERSGLRAGVRHGTPLKGLLKAMLKGSIRGSLEAGKCWGAKSLRMLGFRVYGLGVGFRASGFRVS